LAEYGDDARILAGGQSLIPMLNRRLIEASVLIDISRLPALGDIADRGDAIEIGAAVTQNTLMNWPQLRQKLPLLAAAAVRRPLSDPQQGNRLRLHRARRSEFGTAAVARLARRRGGAALE